MFLEDRKRREKGFKKNLKKYCGTDNLGLFWKQDEERNKTYHSQQPDSRHIAEQNAATSRGLPATGQLPQRRSPKPVGQTQNRNRDTRTPIRNRRCEMKRGYEIILVLGVLVLAGGLFAGWTPFMPVWDTDNWDFPVLNNAAYTDSLGNCIILSQGFTDPETLRLDAFVYNRELGRFDTFNSVLKHTDTEGSYFLMAFWPYYFHNLIGDDNGLIYLPVVMPPHHAYYLTFDGRDFTSHYLSLPDSSLIDCQMKIFAHMRGGDALALAISNLDDISGLSCCSTYVIPDVTNPDSIVALWPDLFPVVIEGFAYKNNSIYLVNREVWSDTRRLSRFEGDSETVMWEIPFPAKYFESKTLKTYTINSDNFITIDSTGLIDTLYSDMSGIYNRRPILSRDEGVLGWLLEFPHDNVFAFLWFEDSTAIIETTSFEGPVSLPFYSLSETTPGMLYGACNSDVYPTSIIGFFVYHDTIVSAIKENSLSEKPEAFAISAWPNPFNSVCRIIIPEKTFSLSIYDMNGRNVYQVEADKCQYYWEGINQNGTKLESGLYFLIASNRMGDILSTQKIIFLK